MPILRNQLNLAIDSDTLDDFLASLHIELEETNPAYSLYDRRTKILVFGALCGTKRDYIMAARKLGISDDNLEFVEYNETKTYNIEKLRYSSQYSDIICGPMPHKIEGIGDNSSFVDLLKSSPEQYPKMYNAVDKLSINVFKQALIQTRFIEKFTRH